MLNYLCLDGFTVLKLVQANSGDYLTSVVVARIYQKYTQVSIRFYRLIRSDLIWLIWFYYQIGLIWFDCLDWNMLFDWIDLIRFDLILMYLISVNEVIRYFTVGRKETERTELWIFPENCWPDGKREIACKMIWELECDNWFKNSFNRYFKIFYILF